MNQSIELSIPLGKLSAPVEVLNLDRRSCRALQRTGMYTVAQIVLTGKPKLSAAKRVGALTTRRVFEAVSVYLGLAEEQLAEASESLPGTCWDPWAAPASILRLPVSILCELKHKGYFQVSQLIKARTTGYSSALWLNAKDIDEVDQALNDYLSRAAQGRLLTYVGMESSLEPPPILSPVLILPLPALREGIWSALERRTLQLSSLEDIRVRTGGTNSQQLHRGIQQAQEHVQQNLNVLSIFLDYFEEKSNRLQENVGTHPLEFETLVEHLLPDPAASEIILHEKEVERMIILMRSLILHRRSWFREEVEAKWPTFILLSCLVEPALAQHEQVRQILEERNPKQKKQTTKETVYSVLARARKPMRWPDIAEQACHLSDRTTVSAATVHNILIWHKELFARVGPGTYALVEWGNQTVETYPAIIASLLRQENRPLPFELIFERVSAIRPVKRSSLARYLDLHPRFYRSIQKSYGLRDWLAQGETQDLPTPDRLREDPTSLKRVERARAKGYHVEKIIAEDRLCEPVPADIL